MELLRCVAHRVLNSLIHGRVDHDFLVLIRFILNVMSVSNLYTEYASLDAQIKALETKKEQLRPHILQMMIDSGEKKVDIGVGNFSVFPTKKWKYPDHVIELGDKFKAAKAKAEQTGEAECEEVDTFRYTPVKL